MSAKKTGVLEVCSGARISKEATTTIISRLSTCTFKLVTLFHCSWYGITLAVNTYLEIKARCS